MFVIEICNPEIRRIHPHLNYDYAKNEPVVLGTSDGMYYPTIIGGPVLFFYSIAEAQKVIDSGYLKVYPDISYQPKIRIVTLKDI